jgi:hypothetical protein
MEELIAATIFEEEVDDDLLVCCMADSATDVLTCILLMWTFGRAPNNAIKQEMGFNSVA